MICHQCGRLDYSVQNHHIIPGSIAWSSFWRLHRIRDREEYQILLCTNPEHNHHYKTDKATRELIQEYKSYLERLRDELQRMCYENSSSADDYIEKEQELERIVTAALFMNILKLNRIEEEVINV